METVKVQLTEENVRYIKEMASKGISMGMVINRGLLLSRDTEVERTFGEVLRTYMEGTGRTAKDFEAKTGIHYQTYYNYINGRTVPPASTVREIEKKLELEEGYFYRLM